MVNGQCAGRGRTGTRDNGQDAVGHEAGQRTGRGRARDNGQDTRTVVVSREGIRRGGSDAGRSPAPCSCPRSPLLEVEPAQTPKQPKHTDRGRMSGIPPFSSNAGSLRLQAAPSFLGAPQELSRHDRLVADRLADGTIRLLSADWLRGQADGFLLSRRQDLPEEAFVPCDRARLLFATRDRGVAALSYGWLHPLHSDPHGVNTSLVINFLRSERGSHVRAMFWDFASLPQRDKHGKRTVDEVAVFRNGLRYRSRRLEPKQAPTVSKPAPRSTHSCLSAAFGRRSQRYGGLIRLTRRHAGVPVDQRSDAARGLRVQHYANGAARLVHV